MTDNTTHTPQAQPADGVPVECPVGRHLPERAEDAISRSKRILEMVDIYCARPDSMNRTALRVALMGEFEDARAQGRGDFDRDDLQTLCAALADYFENGAVLDSRRARARSMWQMLRARC
jgi:hypothetical protein